jgi:hypothetical protein
MEVCSILESSVRNLSTCGTESYAWREHSVCRTESPSVRCDTFILRWNGDVLYMLLPLKVSRYALE